MSGQHSPATCLLAALYVVLSHRNGHVTRSSPAVDSVQSVA